MGSVRSSLVYTNLVLSNAAFRRRLFCSSAFQSNNLDQEMDPGIERLL